MTAWNRHRHQKSNSNSKNWSLVDWLILGLGILFVTVALIYWQAQNTLDSLTRNSDLTFTKIAKLYRQSQTLPLKQDQQHTNLLILGTDTLNYRNASSPLTDTIMLVSLDLSTNTITLLPIPRDIYLPQYNSKINALYSQYYATNQETALEKTTTALSELFNLPLHYSLVVSLADVADFLTLIDGVEVTIVNSFTDYQYPRDDIDITKVFDPTLLYETVSFTAGPTHLDASTAIKFMRSRHALGLEGSDYARSARQQQVFTAVATTVYKQLLTQLKRYDFSFLAQLYQFYQDHFATQIPFVQLLSYTKHFLAQASLPHLASAKLAIAPEAPANLVEKDGQEWSLQIKNLPALIQEIHTKLGLQSTKQ
jgi:LCP family protein required for cell wall assembly